MKAVLMGMLLCAGAMGSELSAPASSPLAPPDLQTWTPSPVLVEATLHVRREFERVGRTVPSEDPVLRQAARSLALKALDEGASKAADAVAVAHEVSRAGGYDPSPRALVIRASPPGRALQSLRARTDVSQEPASYFGVAEAHRGDDTVLVVLTVDREVQLKAFPHRLPATVPTRPLCGELRGSLDHPEVYVTRPSGAVDKVPLTRELGNSFCSTLVFPTEGEHSIEVLAHGAGGPQVVALFHVEVGYAEPSATLKPTKEPSTLADSRKWLLDRINAVRSANGTGPLHGNDALNALAQGYSDRMAKEHFFAHVAPDGESLTLRLRRANFLYSRAGENLGLAVGPIAAQEGIEQSPGHRRNLLDPDFEQLGLGIATEQAAGDAHVVVTEVFTAPPRKAEEAVAMVYRALTARRNELKLPPLERTPALDELALTRAREQLLRGSVQKEPPDSKLQQAIFAAVPDAQLTSTDLFVADSPNFVPESQGLRRRATARVGIGAVRGSAPPSGREQYWVVIIYTGGR